MTSLDFPASPTNGQTYDRYIYDASAGVWNANEPLTVARFTPSPTAPSIPRNGDGWFNTVTGVIYIFYVSDANAVWVQAGSTNLGYPAGASIVTSSTRPSTPFTGQFIYETDTRLPFVWTGSEWVVSGGAGGGFETNFLLMGG